MSIKFKDVQQGVTLSQHCFGDPFPLRLFRFTCKLPVLPMCNMCFTENQIVYLIIVAVVSFFLSLLLVLRHTYYKFTSILRQSITPKIYSAQK